MTKEELIITKIIDILSMKGNVFGQVRSTIKGNEIQITEGGSEFLLRCDELKIGYKDVGGGIVK